MKIPKNPSSSLVALCSAVYFTSYLTRKAYEASILAICDETGLARTSAGLAGTAMVALYGSGQFATNLSSDRYNGAVFAVNAAANVAIVAVFALVAGCVRFSNWRLSFWLVAGIAFAMAAAWWRQCSAGFGSRTPKFADSGIRIPSAKPATRNLNPDSATSFPIAVAVLVPIALAIVCQGAMRDGIEVWAPSIVSDLYGLGTASSTASVALLPLFAVASMAGARALRRALGDETRAALALFAIGLGCALALLASRGGSLAAGLPLLALLSASMHGANLMLVGELPGRFAGSGHVGMLSGLLNACVYVGAAVSIYGFAAIHGHFNGWQPVFALWTVVLAVALALCLKAQTHTQPQKKTP